MFILRLSVGSDDTFQQWVGGTEECTLGVPYRVGEGRTWDARWRTSKACRPTKGIGIFTSYADDNA